MCVFVWFVLILQFKVYKVFSLQYTYSSINYKYVIFNGNAMNGMYFSSSIIAVGIIIIEYVKTKNRYW